MSVTCGTCLLASSHSKLPIAHLQRLLAAMSPTIEQQVAGALAKIRTARQGLDAGAEPSSAESLGNLLFDSADLLVAGIRIEAAKREGAELVKEKAMRCAAESRTAELEAVINDRCEAQDRLIEKCATLQRQHESMSQQLEDSKLREMHVRKELERLQEIIAGTLIWLPPRKWAPHERLSIADHLVSRGVIRSRAWSSRRPPATLSHEYAHIGRNRQPLSSSSSRPLC